MTTMWLLSRGGAAVSLFLYLLHSVSGGYVVTWPKNWLVGEPAQFCFALDAVAKQGDAITVFVEVPDYKSRRPDFYSNIYFPYSGGTARLPQTVIKQLNLDYNPVSILVEEQLTPNLGVKHSCVSLRVPALDDYSQAMVRIRGSLSGAKVDKSGPIIIGKVSPYSRTFIQTDKVMYKPGQKVQFRVLTLEVDVSGIKVLNEPYPVIYVVDPAGSRIEQWLDVPNPSGLIHLDFQLLDESAEGAYSIRVETGNEVQLGLSQGILYTAQFSVEKYVLPRFDMSVDIPGSVLASDDSLKLEVCARYTFGEPVSGTLAINIDTTNYYSSDKREVNFIDQLSGCEAVEISLAPLLINDYGSPVYQLQVVVQVEEEGTGEVVNEIFTLLVSRTAVQFDQEFWNYPKPELPYFGSLRAQFADGKPARNEPMTVCSTRWVLPIEAQRMRQLTGCATVPPSSTQNSPMTLCPEIVCQYVGTDKYGIPKTACFLSLCRNITTDDAGVLHVTIPPHLFSEPLVEARVEVTAVNYPAVAYVNNTSYFYMEKSSSFLYITSKPYYSPSDSSLFIKLDDLVVECTPSNNIDLQLPVLYAASGPARVTLYVQVISIGKILLLRTFDIMLTGSSIDVDDETLVEPMMPPSSPETRRGTFTLPLTFPRTIRSTVRVLIWYVRPDGEVVSDEQELRVKYCPEYPVQLSWPSERVEVGTELPLSLTAQPNALCSVGIVDKSVELLSSTQLSFLDEISSFADILPSQPFTESINNEEHCKRRSGEATLRRDDGSGAQPDARMIGTDSYPVWFSEPLYIMHVDAIQSFADAGVDVASDQTLETRPCMTESLDGNVGRPSLNLGCMLCGGLLGGLMGGAQGPQSLSSQGATSAGLGGNSGSVTPPIDVKTRVYFPETWLWELQTIPDTGIYSENRILPDTITEWVGRAVCVHPEKGVGISEPSSITTFTPFFIDLTLPPSVKVGEILHVKISVFNYIDTSLPVRVTLEQSSEYEILGTSGTEAAADQATAGVRSACVPSDDKETVIVRIRFLEAGPVNITVSAEVVPGLVNNCDSGNPTNGRDRIITPINVDYEGFVRETFHSLYYCTNSTTKYDEWTLTAPPVANIVDSSVRAWITATGDLIGPNLQNLDWLIRMPYGCGEQNLAKFAPNVYILQYLQRSRQYNATVANTLIEYMNRGYQQQLNYRRSDGSYSVFGSRDQYGSTWLTAFVLKTYAQARMYIKIDPSAVSSSADWLLSLQLPSGCFQLVGYVHNTRMKGGLGEGSTPGALTAYVMAALLEGGKPTDSEQIANATACVEAATAAGAIGENDVYLLALKAYAFSLAGLPQTADVIDDLLTRAEENSDGTFWEIQSHSGWFSASLSVETTSYVLLAMLKSNYPDPQGRKLRLLKWILSRRNGYGGFVSTQDTVIGLQALALFGSPVPNEPFDAEVTFSWNSVVKTLQVTEDKKRLLQRFNVEPIPAQIDVEFSGDGCIFVESVVRYNVKDPDVSQVFTLSVFTNIDYYAAICQSSIVRVCATYDPINIESNMAIIEVNLVSGYLPDIQDLERIVSDVTGSIKRYEVDGSQVIFYVDQFGDSQICVEFTAFEDTEIELTAPGTVRVYDYYEPDFYVSEVFRFSRRYCS